MPAILLPLRTPQVTSRPSSSDSSSLTSRWPLPQPHPPPILTKLAPQWKGPYRVCRMLNEYQVTYEDGGLERTIHINHAKPAKFTAPDLPEPVPPAEAPRPPLGHLPAGLARRPPKPRAPPAHPRLTPIPSPPPQGRSSNTHCETPRRGSSQSASRTRSTPPPISPTQPRARSSSRYFKLPSSPPTSLSIQLPHSEPLQYGPHLSSHYWVQRIHGVEGEPSLLRQPSTGGSPQRPKSVPQHDEAACRRPPQDGGSCFLLCAERPHRPPRTTPPSPLMRAAMWLLLPSDRVFRRSSTSLHYYLTRQGRRVVLRGGDVTRPPLERSKENHPPSSQPSKLPRKMRPRRRKRGHHQQHLPGTNGNAPGTDLRPKEGMRTSVKHPQPPQHPRPAANENSSRVNLPDQADHGRLYKRAPPSRVKESTERSRRDYFSGSSPSFSSKRPHQDYFSGSPYRATNKNMFMTDPLREAISLSQSGCCDGDRPCTDPTACCPAGLGH